MRAVIQRVRNASVSVDSKIIGNIRAGLLLFLGITKGDTESDIKYIAEKALNLRIFEDENGKMNNSLIDTNGELLIVSQFTLYGDCRKGKRPSFDRAETPSEAEKIYDAFVEYCRSNYVLKIETGKFQAMMEVKLVNDGPVTMLLDSSKIF